MEERFHRTGDILVYDLEPRDNTAVELIECLTQHRPALQVLLYTHPTPRLERLISAALKLDGVWLAHRSEDGRDSLELHKYTAGTAETPSSTDDSYMIRLLLGSTSKRVDSFIGQALEQIGTTALVGSVRVADIWSVVGGQPRSMGRRLAPTALRQPQELLKWLTLLLCVQLMEASTDLEVTTQRLGYCGGKRLYRLRRGLIGNRRLLGKTLDQEVDIEFPAFPKRCRVPVKQAARVLQEKSA